MNKHCTLFTKSILCVMQSFLLVAMSVILVMLSINLRFCANRFQSEIYIDPFEQVGTFEESSAFEQIYESDVTDLIRYLAICEQFEKNGVYDVEKSIDLLQYCNRKNVNSDAYTSNGELCYRASDLVNWLEIYGFTYTNDLLYEAFLPTDGVSIYDKDIWKLLQQNELSQVVSSVDSGYVEEYGNYGEPVYDEYAEQEADGELYPSVAADQDETADQDVIANQDETTDQDVTESKSRLMESGETLTANEESTLAKNYVEEPSTEAVTDQATMEEYLESYQILYSYIISAASDLSYNYESYLGYNDYYKNNRNFKFLYIPNGNEGEYYTNLTINKGENVADKAKLFKTLDTYAIYDLDQFTISSKNGKQVEGIIRSEISNYSYAFREGGTFYIGIVNEDIKGFANYNKEDCYAIGATKFQLFNQNIWNYVIAFMAMFVLDIILFVWVMVLTGRKRNQEGIVFIWFDKLFTEPAFGIAVFGWFGYLFASAYVLENINYNYVSQTASLSNALLFTKETPMVSYLFLFAIAVVVVIGNALFLFFFASLIRRIKAKTMWSNSIFKKAIGFAKKIYCETKDHSSIVVRTWIPYLFFLVINLSLMFIFQVAGIVLAFMFDMCVGAYLHYENHMRARIVTGIKKISDGDLSYQVDLTHIHGENLILAESVNHIGAGIKDAVETSLKDERLKADLITNVSHDIKTPLTSIINYVDLLKREKIENEKVKEYLDVLDEKSQRLKQLTEDLVEASKISSGNITIEKEVLNVNTLMNQAMGEYAEKFEKKNLDLVVNTREEATMISGDSRHMWRIMDNLLNNIYKYALAGTRVYVDITDGEQFVFVTFKNISASALNIHADELTERFIRGDVSRSTEGSGLGLSIAKNLMEAQGGTFTILLDGDLFKVVLKISK